MKLTIRLLTISIFLLSVQFSFGQVISSNEKKKKSYIVYVKPLYNAPAFKGYLSEIGDTLVIVPLKLNNPIKKIRLDKVNYLEFKEKGKTGRGILLGGLAGFGLGAIIGYATYKPNPCPTSSSGFSICIDLGPGANAMGGGILGIIPGLLIGGIVGSKKIQVPIQGSKKSIQAQKEEIQKYKFGG
jgi:hypothetical protein